ncbi:hypothetical protein POM88_025733 [Heracleum sosnowskyi]|uniref:Uncharacterized protein n=1 Tax=Heracleum sosnowskyi TaxID=360622 RepID=A0AAD8I7J4_9APIA|nr:hypothetical protein POM88_025725 [Heracleum sosnowskyi]KAK1378985.1 hypothetical protein POM88_025729 [Heracleum sosnowskyi]KAK1378989.1 hypothetical protein POM88_025733 [Heracleum sosnowskyi]
MKSGVSSSTITSSQMKKEVPSFYRYLKPGALARIRYSKFTAKSKGLRCHDSSVDLKLIGSPSAEMISQTQMSQMPVDRVPSFPFPKISEFSPSGQRKKLFAAPPTFCDDIQS